MSKKNIIIIVVIVVVLAQLIYFGRDYIWPQADKPINRVALTNPIPASPDQYMDFGFDQIQIDKLSESIDQFLPLVESGGATYLTYLRLASIYTMLQEFEMAETVLLMAVEKDPELGGAYGNLGELYGAFMKEKQKAVDNMKIAITKSPDHYEYYEYLAALYRSDFPELEDLVEPLMIDGAEKNPENTNFYNYLSYYFEQKQDYEKAILYMTKAVEIDPQNESLAEQLQLLKTNYGQ